MILASDHFCTDNSETNYEVSSNRQNKRTLVVQVRQGISLFITESFPIFLPPKSRYHRRKSHLYMSVIKQDGHHSNLIKVAGPYQEMYNAQAHYYQEEVSAC